LETQLKVAVIVTKARDVVGDMVTTSDAIAVHPNWNSV
jgi:hypothetical protein